MIATTTIDVRLWARWVASFIGFPLAGLAAMAVAGPIDSTAAAIAGGLAAGAVLGGIQSFALRLSAAQRATWAAVTAIALGIGLGIGATVVGFGYQTGDLVVMGLVTGASIGGLQAMLLHGGVVRGVAWAVATPVLWALGWAITSQVITDTDDQFANFGASGALVATAIGGVIIAVRPTRASPPAGVGAPSASGTSTPVHSCWTTGPAIPGQRAKMQSTTHSGTAWRSSPRSDSTR